MDDNIVRLVNASRKDMSIYQKTVDLAVCIKLIICENVNKVLNEVNT